MSTNAPQEQTPQQPSPFAGQLSEMLLPIANAFEQGAMQELLSGDSQISQARWQQLAGEDPRLQSDTVRRRVVSLMRLSQAAVSSAATAGSRGYTVAETNLREWPVVNKKQGTSALKVAIGEKAVVAIAQQWPHGTAGHEDGNYHKLTAIRKGRAALTVRYTDARSNDPRWGYTDIEVSRNGTDQVLSLIEGYNEPPQLSIADSLLTPDDQGRTQLEAMVRGMRSVEHTFERSVVAE